MIESLWLVPLLLGSVGVMLGLLLPWLDRRMFAEVSKNDGASSMLLSPSSAEAFLTTSTGAMATVLGVAFSLTVVTLQLASVQYSSRILRRFMVDRFPQWVLGVFLGSITFFALSLRAVQVGTGDDPGFVPPLSIATSMLLLILCLVLLTLLLHHLMRSIQASFVVDAVATETIRAITKRSPEENNGEDDKGFELPAGDPQLVYPLEAGYLQMIDGDRLRDAVPPGCTCLRVQVKPGQFVLPTTAMVAVWSSNPLDTSRADGLREAFAIGSERTLHQDMLFGIRQLVDLALRALSPGVNDVTTALMAVNQLGAVLAAVVRSPIRAEEGHKLVRDGTLVTVFPRFGLRSVVEDTYAELLRSALEHPRILSRLAEILAELLALLPRIFVANLDEDPGCDPRG